MSNDINRSHPLHWKYKSPDAPGFHEVISPENSPCKSIWIFRLNLLKGKNHIISNKTLELSSLVIEGEIECNYKNKKEVLVKKDGFYIPSNTDVEIRSLKDSVIFIGGAKYEDIGEFFIFKFDPFLPLGEVHQIHGKPPYQREVFLTVNPEKKASRLITGITWGEEGAWTSWPPHQHTRDLEEVYCYFDIPFPKYALQLLSRNPGVIEAVIPVSSNDFIIVPEGYHPTVGIPGTKSCYFWVMAAHRKESRRYDLAVPDPNFV